MKNNNNRIFKKFLAIVLSLSLVLSFSIPTFAGDDAQGESLISNLAGSDLMNQITNAVNQFKNNEATSGISDKVTDISEKITTMLTPSTQQGETPSSTYSPEEFAKQIIKAAQDAGLLDESGSIKETLLTKGLEAALASLNLDKLEDFSYEDAIKEINEKFEEVKAEVGENNATSEQLLLAIVQGIKDYVTGSDTDTDEDGEDGDDPTTPGTDTTAVVLTIVTNDGQDPLEYETQAGQVLDLTDVIPTRDGYTFVGWYSDKELTNKITSVTLDKDVTIYAKWEAAQDDDSSVTIVNPFTDVHESDYFYLPVLCAVANGWTTGTTPTTFSPNNPCTRAQAITFIWRGAGEPAPSTQTTAFKDIKPSDYYYQAVLWGYENGFITGTSATTFSPDKPCTRAQIVTILYRGSGLTATTGVTPFKDVPSNAYYAKAVYWAVVTGVTTGTSATTFSPDATCTRAQIVTFIYRFAQ